MDWIWCNSLLVVVPGTDKVFVVAWWSQGQTMAWWSRGQTKYFQSTVVVVPGTDKVFAVNS